MARGLVCLEDVVKHERDFITGIRWRGVQKLGCDVDQDREQFLDELRHDIRSLTETVRRRSVRFRCAIE